MTEENWAILNVCIFRKSFALTSANTWLNPEKKCLQKTAISESAGVTNLSLFARDTFQLQEVLNTIISILLMYGWF